MIIVDAIHHSHSDVEVYELLNFYIDAVPLTQNADGATLRPIENRVCAMKQMQALFVALGLASRRLDDPSRVVIKQALYVFHAALDRLHSLADVSEPRNCAREARSERVEQGHFLGHERRRVAGDARCLLA
jgi:hypothetical protein